MQAIQDRSAETYNGPLNSDASSTVMRIPPLPQPVGRGLVYPPTGSVNTTSERTDVATSLERDFNILAARWQRETRYLSSASKMAMHPAYQRIISLGQRVIPLILRDLQQTRGHWLWALYVLSEFQDPAPEGATFEEAVEAWLHWGRTQGLVA